MNDEALIEEFIRKRGITKCPTYIAEGAQTQEILEKIPSKVTDQMLDYYENRYRNWKNKTTAQKIGARIFKKCKKFKPPS